MVKYIIKRVLIGLLTLIVLVAITFAMTKVMPGSPLQSKNVSGEVLQKMEATYGLDKPPVEQFFIYCKNICIGAGSWYWIRNTDGKIKKQCNKRNLVISINTWCKCSKLHCSIVTSYYIWCRT